MTLGSRPHTRRPHTRPALQIPTDWNSRGIISGWGSFEAKSLSDTSAKACRIAGWAVLMAVFSLPLALFSGYVCVYLKAQKIQMLGIFTLHDTIALYYITWSHMMP